MNIKLASAAKELNLHPANIFAYLKEIGANFEQIWPEVDQTWINIIRDKNRNDFIKNKENTSKYNDKTNILKQNINISEFEKMILKKLYLARKWGGARVSFEQLQKHTRIPGPNLELALLELIEIGYINSENRSGPYSLNSANKAIIENIVSVK